MNNSRLILAFVIGLMLLSTVSCRRSAQITSFNASPTSLAAGDSAQLCYELINAVKARIEPNVGELNDKSKSCLKVEPQQTTNYTLLAEGGDGKTTSTQVTVNVAPPPLAKIVKFEARQDANTRAPGTPAELCYEVSGASSVTIKPDIGDVAPGEKGCRAVKPTTTTEYELAATGTDNKTVTEQATVTVVQPPARIVRFDVLPENIKAGEKVSMCYQVQDAAGANISNLNHSVKLGPEQCFEFQPYRSTTFILAARNSDSKSVSREARVTVEQLPVEIVDFTAQPNEVEKGKGTVLRYKLVNARNAQIVYSGGTIRLKNPDGTVPINNLLSTTDFKLTALDPDDKPTSKAITVTVVPPRQAEFLVKPVNVAINKGSAARLCYGVTWGSTVTISSQSSPAPKPLPSSENWCINFSPNATDTYTLTAIGPNENPVRAGATVTVITPPQQVQFFAQAVSQRSNEIRILRGDRAELCFRLVNVESFTITPKVGDLQLSTARCVNLGELEKTTDYTLRVTGLDKVTLNYHVTVHVYPPPEILRFDVQSSGGRNFLCFQYRNFIRAEISPAVADLSRYPNGAGCVVMPSPPSPQYTLTVYGRGKVAPARLTFPRR